MTKYTGKQRLEAVKAYRKGTGGQTLTHRGRKRHLDPDTGVSKWVHQDLFPTMANFSFGSCRQRTREHKRKHKRKRGIKPRSFCATPVVSAKRPLPLRSSCRPHA